MTMNLPPLDEQVDQLLRAVLRSEADNLAVRQPTLADAVESLAPRLGSRRVAIGPSVRVGTGPRRAVSVAWLALLLATAVAAVIVGTHLLWEDRSPIVEATRIPDASVRPIAQAPEFGFGRPCEVPIEPDVLVEAEWGFDLAPAKITYRRSGAVTEVLVATMGPVDPAKERETAVSHLHVTTWVLPPTALDEVEARLADDLDLAPGCYTLRTWEAEGLLRAATPAGPIEINFSRSGGEWTLARMASVAESETLRLLVDALSRRDGWLSDNRPELSQPDRWIVHSTFEPTGYAADQVVRHRDRRPASAEDGRYDEVVLPGGADLAAFGAPMDLPATGFANATQRCAVLTSGALELARSLDAVDIGIEGVPDLYTPDMAHGIYVSLVPAPDDYDCEAFEADLRERGAGVAPLPPAVVGDLADVDPCSLVPAPLKGTVETGYGWPDPALGVAARRCVLRNDVDFGETLRRETVWLFPRRISEPEAALVAASLFGERMATEMLGGRPLWLNHCHAGPSECVVALAMWMEGRLLILEIVDRGVTPAERTERGRAILAGIAGQT